MFQYLKQNISVHEAKYLIALHFSTFWVTWEKTFFKAMCLKMPFHKYLCIWCVICDDIKWLREEQCFSKWTHHILVWSVSQVGVSSIVSIGAFRLPVTEQVTACWEGKKCIFEEKKGKIKTFAITQIRSVTIWKRTIFSLYVQLTYVITVDLNYNKIGCNMERWNISKSKARNNVKTSFLDVIYLFWLLNFFELFQENCLLCDILMDFAF